MNLYYVSLRDHKPPHNVLRFHVWEHNEQKAHAAALLTAGTAGDFYVFCSKPLCLTPPTSSQVSMI